MHNFISEDQIEQALLQRLQHICGFDVLDCLTADPADLNDGSGRLDKRDVLLPARLKAAVLKLNPHIPASAVDVALARLADRRQAMSLVAAKGTQLKVSVTASPEGGRATDHMLRFLAPLFGVPISQIDVVFGQTNVNKQLRIRAPKSLPAVFGQPGAQAGRG